MRVFTRQIFLLLIVGVALVAFSSDFCFGHQSPACGCGHTHDEAHHHHADSDSSVLSGQSKKLPEELAEEEDLRLYGFESTHNHIHNHDHHHHDHKAVDPKLSGAGLWIHALGCSLLVSMASLICLVILPVMFVKGKPSKAIVDSLALFGAGAMLGDAFLHQLPHAFGGQHSHGHEDHHSHGHDHDHSGHAHSLKDLSVGLSVLSGIVVFLIVEKVVRYVEERSEGSNSWSHHHHHHHNKKGQKVKDDGDVVEKLDGSLSSIDEQHNQPDSALKKRKKNAGRKDDKSAMKSNGALVNRQPADQPSNLVFGYLNLFSDGVHNFTDGIALGSAFLLYGSVGGWSRTLFLLAHELPQEIGDFGILVRSGFSVPKALFFNFLSALVALGGTALVLLIGQDPGQSSVIEGFTAGGFIYISVAGVLAEMNNNGISGWKSTIMQLLSLISGMAIALCISLVE